MALDGVPNRQAILDQLRFWHERTELLVKAAPATELFDLGALEEARRRMAEKNPFG